MFQQKFALAAASVLILSGCAVGSWQRAADHPADPAGQAGMVQPVTSLERYRAAAQPSKASKPEASPSEDGHSHHQHGEDAQ